MNLKKIILAICSVLFIMIGIDKFVGFMEPPCSIEETINPTVWMILGGLQILAAILIWSSKYQKAISSFFVAIMVFFSIYHLSNNTSDIGGAIFMAGLLVLLVWNPAFINSTMFKSRA